MAARVWRLVVTGLGGTVPLNEVTVDADNWMTALRLGRKAIGEDGAVPTGASCAVAPSGVVTILDPLARRSYVLSPTTDATTSVPPTSAPSIPAAAPSPSNPPISSPPGARVSKATMAYVVPPGGFTLKSPSEIGSTPPPARISSRPSSPAVPAVPVPAAARASAPAPASVPDATSVPDAASVSDAASAPDAASVSIGPPVAASPPVSADSTPPRPRVSKATVAYISPSQLPVPPAPPPVAAPPAPPPPPPAPTGNIEVDDGFTPLTHRDEEPTAQNPLLYRERTFLIAPDLRPEDAARVLRSRFDALVSELETLPPGKFFNFAAFDHRWEGKPQRPPIVTLQWKDWRGPPEIDYPAARRASAPPRANPAPSRPPSSPTNVSASRSSRPPSGTDQDERLAKAFEALQDLFFLRTPADGLEFVVRLLRDTVPSEAISACLYDINTDEFRFVALDGTNAEARKGSAVPSTGGLLGHAVRAQGTVILIEDVPGDDRYIAAIDGRSGVDARTMMITALAHDGRLLGVLQLINRSGQPQFSRGDVNVVTYVGKQLAEFLHSTKTTDAVRRR